MSNNKIHKRHKSKGSKGSKGGKGSKGSKTSQSMALLDMSQDYSCGICTEILWHPATLNCGHNYCIHCLARLISFHNEASHQCPICRANIKGKKIRQNLILQSLLQKLYSHNYQKGSMKKDRRYIIETYLDCARARNLTKEIEKRLTEHTLISFRKLAHMIRRNMKEVASKRDSTDMELLTIILEGKSQEKWNIVNDLILRKSLGSSKPMWSQLDTHSAKTFPRINKKNQRVVLSDILSKREIDIPQVSHRATNYSSSDEYSYDYYSYSESDFFS